MKENESLKEQNKRLMEENLKLRAEMKTQKRLDDRVGGYIEELACINNELRFERTILKQENERMVERIASLKDKCVSEFHRGFMNGQAFGETSKSVEIVVEPAKKSRRTELELLSDLSHRMEWRNKK